MAPEWGIAFAALMPEAVEMLGPDKPMRLYVIRPDGSGLTPLTDYMEFLSGLTSSPDGRYLLFSARREVTCGPYGPAGYFDLPHLYRVDVASGEVFTLTSGTTTAEWLATWSPDGEQIAFVSSEVNIPCSPAPPCYEENCTPVAVEYHTHLYVMDRDGRERRRLTAEEGEIKSVAWSPTGEWIAFEQHSAVWVVRPDGSEQRKVADVPIEYHWRPYVAQPVWSPDGRRIAFAAPGVGEERNADIFITNVDGSGLLNLTRNPAEDFQPAWSPDGQYVAFVSNQAGYPHMHTVGIFMATIDGSGVTQIFYSSAGAFHPIWSPDGACIAFVVSGHSAMLEEYLFLANLNTGLSSQLSQEFIGDRPAWVLMPSHSIP
jgi:Tol biopolymer transport system component